MFLSYEEMESRGTQCDHKGNRRLRVEEAGDMVLKAQICVSGVGGEAERFEDTPLFALKTKEETLAKECNGV